MLGCSLWVPASHMAAFLNEENALRNVAAPLRCPAADTGLCGSAPGRGADAPGGAAAALPVQGGGAAEGQVQRPGQSPEVPDAMWLGAWTSQVGPWRGHRLTVPVLTMHCAGGAVAHCRRQCSPRRGVCHPGSGGVSVLSGSLEGRSTTPSACDLWSRERLARPNKPGQRAIVLHLSHLVAAAAGVAAGALL